jgi:hypothetical protein
MTRANTTIEAVSQQMVMNFTPFGTCVIACDIECASWNFFDESMKIVKKFSSHFFVSFVLDDVCTSDLCSYYIYHVACKIYKWSISTRRRVFCGWKALQLCGDGETRSNILILEYMRDLYPENK